MPTLPATASALQQGLPPAPPTHGVVAVRAGAGEPGLPRDELPRDGRWGAAGGAAWHAARLWRGLSHQMLPSPAAPGDAARPTIVGTAQGARAPPGCPRRRPDNAKPPGPGVPDDVSGATATAEARVACAGCLLALQPTGIRNARSCPARAHRSGWLAAGSQCRLPPPLPAPHTPRQPRREVIPKGGWSPGGMVQLDSWPAPA